LIVDGGLFEVVNHPLVITWSYLDVVIDKLFYFLLVDFVVLLLERPILFSGVLEFFVHLVEVADVVVRHNLS
jgi:hypothetical protein